MYGVVVFPHLYQIPIPASRILQCTTLSGPDVRHALTGIHVCWNYFLVISGAYGEVRMAMSKFGTEQHAVKVINKQRTIFGNRDQEEVSRLVYLPIYIQYTTMSEFIFVF